MNWSSFLYPHFAHGIAALGEDSNPQWSDFEMFWAFRNFPDCSRTGWHGKILSGFNSLCPLEPAAQAWQCYSPRLVLMDSKAMKEANPVRLWETPANLFYQALT